jgi:hypothetical protein
MRIFYALYTLFTYPRLLQQNILNKKVLTPVAQFPILNTPDWANTNNIADLTEKNNFIMFKLLTSYIRLSILNHNLIQISVTR